MRDEISQRRGLSRETSSRLAMENHCATLVNWPALAQLQYERFLEEEDDETAVNGLAQSFVDACASFALSRSQQVEALRRAADRLETKR